jgi:hypothetical protein
MAHVGTALVDPAEFAARWQRREAEYGLAIWIALALTAIAGTTGYGMTMGIGQGMTAIGTKAMLLTIGAGMAWAIPLPALYILNSIGGSRLLPSTTLLAALTTTSWGGLAMLASVPINWLFMTAVPDLPFLGPTAAGWVLLAVNLVVFAGVGVAMIDVFGRVMQRLEPEYGRRPVWFLLLVAMIGSQLFYLFGLFTM